MAQSHGHTHDHAHGHDQSHGRVQLHADGHHGHAHGPSSPHPAQPVRWSILRMTLGARVAAAAAISAGLWTVVLLAMR